MNAVVPALSLQHILDLPFPTELRAAHVGDSVAWIYNERGSRNLWIGHAGVDPVPARRLTALGGDDGIALGQLRWNRACDAVIYVSGAVLADGAVPNPTSGPGGGRAPEIWRVSVAGGAPRRLGAGHSPEVSPATGDIAWIHEGQIWFADEQGQVPPRRLIVDRGVCSGLAWSSDGRHLAFCSSRGEHAFIGVYDAVTEAVRWLSPSVDRDTFPTWSPNGEEIAFVRLADDPAPTYMARRSGTPWALWVANARTGEGRCVWTAAEGRGSVFMPLASGPQILWMPSGQLVFPWESSGWLHLHAWTPGSTEAVDLTPGPFEVSGMTRDPNGEGVLCTTNRGDVDSFSLWRVDIPTCLMAALLSSPAIACNVAVTGGGCVVALQADARTPLQPVSIDRQGQTRSLAPNAPLGDFPFEQLVKPLQVSFPSADGQIIRAQLFLPPAGIQVAPRPAIVHFHGGPARQMFPAWHPMECYHLQYGMNQVLASKGYVVMSVNYRGGTGYGLDFREPEGLGAGGASEHQDAVGAAQFLRGRADVDARRIGVYGVSYGGLMTGLALARTSDLFAAGVDWSGVSNWQPAFTGAPASVVEAASRSSPQAAVSQWRSPVLFIHADDDREVPFSQTIGLVKALRRQPGVEVECLVLPDEQHDFVLRRSWGQALEATADFFDRTIGLVAA